MKTIDLKQNTHQLSRVNNFQSEDKGGLFFWWTCEKCGIMAKQYGVTDFLNVMSHEDLKKVKNCIDPPKTYPKQVKLIDVSSLYQWGFKKDEVCDTLKPNNLEKHLRRNSVICQAKIKRVAGDIEFERVVILPFEFTYIEDEKI